MLEVFFDYDSVIHYEFISEGQTVNKELYLEILKRLRDASRRKRPEKLATNDWFLLHDIAPSHSALIMKKYLTRHSVTTLEHPPYSPDLAPADFYLFPRQKMKWKGNRFVDSDEVIENNWTSQKMDSRSVLNSYTNAGRSVWMQEESTLKANKLMQALEQSQTSTFGCSRYLVPTEAAHSLLLTMRRTTSWIRSDSDQKDSKEEEEDTSKLI
ncbi:hypothetical protein AVEN_99017-1 [Araneus ventricosus]|uniref:Mariner Mos1 transposase n=1 Tax=Araneus ventricosus TaxID=182803 RepID=A0A4Y2G9G6_ARAVE|nr:hypothetical protein AVEN_99017-1 [Araneus ventricosus]